MAIPFLQTARLALELESTDAVLARIAAMPAADRAEVSPEWLARLRAAPEPEPWTHGFAIVERATGVVVGSCGFTGRPDSDDTVEIAYGLQPEHQRRGFAREAARALSEYALTSGGARCVRAHTRANNDRSSRVLLACGYSYVGEVVMPEDGLVHRWELRSIA